MEANELVRRYDAGQRDFERAKLSGAKLEGANVTSEQLGKAASVRGAAMPNGTKHE